MPATTPAEKLDAILRTIPEFTAMIQEAAKFWTARNEAEYRLAMNAAHMLLDDIYSMADFALEARVVPRPQLGIVK